MEDHSQLERVRLEKLDRIRELGVDPYPHTFRATHTVPEILEGAEGLLAGAAAVSVAGRLMVVRGQGKAVFAHIQNLQRRLQIYVRLDAVGERAFELFGLCEPGDHVGVAGDLFHTKLGELTLRASSVELLSKAVKPMPMVKVREVDGRTEVFDQVTDKEFRYRQRYVDLTVNPEVAEVFIKRSRIIQAIREYLLERRFLEVETPTLQTIYGGANAQPFKTRHNALGVDFYLRISNELFLKRLIVGGLDRVFEFVKNFRNEGIDRTHNPEFTALEFYQAYADYTDMMAHTEAIWERCALAVHGSTRFTFQGVEIDVKAPWRRLTMLEAIRDLGGIDFAALSDDGVRDLLKARGWELDGAFSRGRAMSLVFEESCEAALVQPTFITDHPLESTPLCKSHRSDPALVERFEAYVNGWEVVNAYTELNDPKLQRERFQEQVERGRGGEAETQPYDHDYVRALEYGMPPAGGIGFGVDRMVMLLTDQANIRDVILFPTLRPEEA